MLELTLRRVRTATDGRSYLRSVPRGAGVGHRRRPFRVGRPPS